MDNKWLVTDNRAKAIAIHDIPIFEYAVFFDDMKGFLDNRECHCASYFAVPKGRDLLFIAIMLDDSTGKVYIGAYLHDMERNDVLPSLTRLYPAMHVFEREIAENFGITYADNPWNKPLRFAHDRANQFNSINDYPFYSIKGDSLHEVNVGPIHAGIIEPGVFRFICNGEEVIHLEIVLGFQHRGLERAMRGTDNVLRQTLLAETIAGDSVAGHTSAYCYTIEKIADMNFGEGISQKRDSNSGNSISGNDQISADASPLDIERAVALELERIAMHIADTGALCGDIAYQLGQVACEALRTIVINTTQLWCGNRFAKGLVRPFGTNYPLTEDLMNTVLKNIGEVERRYAEVAHNLLVTPSVLARFEDCGSVLREQALAIGAVGLAARASGVSRDVRASHPWGAYGKFTPVVLATGDIVARLQMRVEEIKSSVNIIRKMLQGLRLKGMSLENRQTPRYNIKLKPECLAFSLIEGWRGEICHVAMSDERGGLAYYKIKDPSLHNWMMLALAVRGVGISDFPICNKSFNLSYCGHDL